MEKELLEFLNIKPKCRPDMLRVYNAIKCIDSEITAITIKTKRAIEFNFNGKKFIWIAAKTPLIFGYYLGKGEWTPKDGYELSGNFDEIIWRAYSSFFYIVDETYILD